MGSPFTTLATLSWHELASNRYQGSLSFCGDIFGWIPDPASAIIAAITCENQAYKRSQLFGKVINFCTHFSGLCNQMKAHESYPGPRHLEIPMPGLSEQSQVLHRDTLDVDSCYLAVPLQESAA